MTDPKPPKADADELARQLQTSLARRRLQVWKPVAALLAFSTLFLALFAWWMYPRPELPLLQIIALDAVCTPDETPQAWAQLFPAPEVKESRSLVGQSVVFQGQKFPLAGANTRESVIKSDSKGQASAVVANESKQAVLEFVVRHFDASRRLVMTPTDPGRIFVWPKDARLLLIDADETLLAKEFDDKAVPILQKAAEDGWQIVYLSVMAAQAEDLRAARERLEAHPGLPAGPILGRRQFPSDESIDQATREVLKALDRRFTGAKVAVVKTAAAAQIGKELGMRVIIIGDAVAGPDVIRVPAWADVSFKLQ